MASLKPFIDFLPIPDLVEPKGLPAKATLSIKAKVKKIKLHKSLPATKVWHYQLVKGNIIKNGSGSSVLGPTVQVNRGDFVNVCWENTIPFAETLPFEVVKVPYIDGTTPVPQNFPGKEANTLTEAQDDTRGDAKNLHSALVTHLHGGRSQADSDGWPDDTATSGQSAYFTYSNDQAATLLWYHDHANHVTRLNVFAGLAGAWLIRDDEEASLNLPDGDFELPLIIQDRNLDLDNAGNFTGALLHKTEVTDGPAEFFGPYTLVNGKIWPKVEVEPRLYRFRALNGSNARTYRIVLLDSVGNLVNNLIYQIGSDQGLMNNKIPLPDTGLILSPGERADLLIDFTSFPNKQLYLWNIAAAPFSADPTTEPTTSQIKTELLQFLDNVSLNKPFFTTTVTADGNSSEINRRYYPQMMRFDVLTSASSPSHLLPPDPLWQISRPPVNLRADMPIRLMALVEKPANPAMMDSTAMLVFWEYVENTVKTPAPPGAEIVTFSYVHPLTGTLVGPKQYWKGAEEFYDQLNWEVHLGDTEQWYIINVSPDTHPIHVHLVDMNVNQCYNFTLTGTTTDPAIPFPNGTPDWVINGNNVNGVNIHKISDISATTACNIDFDQTGPKDTIRINPGEMIGVAMKFSPYCGKYIYHCHILEHEDHDMMRPFVIVPQWLPHHKH